MTDWNKQAVNKLGFFAFHGLMPVSQIRFLCGTQNTSQYLHITYIHALSISVVVKRSGPRMPPTPPMGEASASPCGR